MTDRAAAASITVELLEPDAALDGRLVERLADIVNVAYSETEGSLWRRQDHRRTEPREFAGVIAREFLIYRKALGERRSARPTMYGVW